jgi:hypothetical protein
MLGMSKVTISRAVMRLKIAIREQKTWANQNEAETRPQEAEVANHTSRRDPRTSTPRHRRSDVYCVLPQRSDTFYLYLQTCA